MKAMVQRDIAAIQAASDVAKAAYGVPPSGGDKAGISGEGARVNHGRDMDDRGVGTGTAHENAASGGPSTDGTTTVTGGETAGDSPSGATTSSEKKYADQGALKYSPDAIGEVHKNLGGSKGDTGGQSATKVTGRRITLSVALNSGDAFVGEMPISLSRRTSKGNEGYDLYFGREEFNGRVYVLDADVSTGAFAVDGQAVMTELPPRSAVIPTMAFYNGASHQVDIIPDLDDAALLNELWRQRGFQSRPNHCQGTQRHWRHSGRAHVTSRGLAW